jgi:hypothetical protein
MRPQDSAYSSWLINRTICLSFCIVSLLTSNRRAKLLRFRYALVMRSKLYHADYNAHAYEYP